MQNNKKKAKFIKKALIIIAWIIVWGVIAVLVNNKLLMASPLETAREFCLLFLDIRFYEAVAGSLVRIALGLITGVALGIMLAVFAYKSELFSEIIMPLINVLKAVPVAAFVVMLLIWFGSKNLAFIICFLVVFPGMFFNILEGLKSTDKALLEMAKVFHLPLKSVYSYIYKPAVKPYFMGAIKVSLGMCWKSGVAAEIIGLTKGSIGERLYMSKIYFETASVFAWTVVIILISFLFEKLIMKLSELYFNAHTEVMSPQVTNAPEDISLKNVVKGFGDEKVIDSFTQTYKKGEVYYINSPSGSGKTTTLNLIAKLLQPDSGEISTSDNVSMVFQTDRLLEEFDSVTNVALATGKKKEARTALLKLLDEDDLAKKVSELSGGMKRRVSVVRAMEAASDVVLLDEPFTGMDDALIERVKKYIMDNQRGRIVIISTHIM